MHPAVTRLQLFSSMLLVAACRLPTSRTACVLYRYAILIEFDCSHHQMCVHCAVTIMSEQVLTITDTTVDTTVRQPVDSAAVSFTDDTTGRFIESSRVSTLGGHGAASKPIGVAWCCNTHICLAASIVRL